jgi:hypothetical protein
VIGHLDGLCRTLSSRETFARMRRSRGPMLMALGALRALGALVVDDVTIIDIRFERRGGVRVSRRRANIIIECKYLVGVY